MTSELAAVSAKLEDGNISAAIRILCSDEVIATYSAETLAKLQLKHPGEHESISFPPQLSPSTALQVGEEDVLRVIRSFPAGLSVGSDGLRSQHLVEMVQSLEAGSGLLSALTQLTNILLQGKCISKYKNATIPSYSSVIFSLMSRVGPKQGDR